MTFRSLCFPCLQFKQFRFQIPVFQRGGTILPKKERIRRATTLMINDPYTLVVCLDKSSEAKGTLYIDDEKSFDYRQGKFVYLEFEFKNNVLSSRSIDEKSTYPTKSWLERVKLAGLTKTPKSATLKTETQTVTLEVLLEGNLVVIRKPGVSMLDKWSITLNF